MLRPYIFLLFTLYATAQTPRRSLLEPVKPIEVTEPGGSILSFRHRSGATEVALRGTKLAPQAHGRLKVESKQGYLELDANRNSFTGLPRPHSFGRDFLTYVLWAVTPDGQAQNLGEILFGEANPDQTTGLNVSTPKQTFWLMATAEPHFAVSQPSNLVVLVSQNQDSLTTGSKALPVKGALLYYTHFDAYRRDAAPLASGVAPELLQARKAVELAENAGILKNPTPAGQEPLPDESRTRETLALAKDFLNRAEQLARQTGAESRRESIQFARTAAQTAEDARALATGAVGQVYIRQLLREIESYETEIQRLTKLDADQKAEIARVTQQLAELTRSSKEALDRLRRENTELTTKLASLQAEMDVMRRDLQQARADLAKLTTERDRLAQDRDRICSELRKQLEALGSLRSEGGRIVLTLASDILFDFNKFDLRDTAREQLAKLAMLQILIFRDVPIKYSGHTDLVGAADYNQWLSEQRALRVAEYLLTQRQQLYKDDPQAGRIAGDLSTIHELLAMDAARSKANPAGRQTLLAPVAALVEGMGDRNPVVNTPGKNEKNRRVEVIFSESKGSAMNSLCETK